MGTESCFGPLHWKPKVQFHRTQNFQQLYFSLGYNTCSIQYTLQDSQILKHLTKRKQTGNQPYAWNQDLIDKTGTQKPCPNSIFTLCPFQS